MKDVSISAAKAIGIILMVYAHCTTPNFFHGVIGGFHMPLFFFFSGYCFKEKKYLQDFNDFARKRINGLYRPFVIWGLFFLLLHNFFYSIFFYNDEYGYIYEIGSVSHHYTFIETIKKGIYVVFTLTKNEQMLGGFWFIHDLFFASFISYFIIKYIKNSYLGLIIALSISLIMQYTSFEVPYYAINGRCFLAVSFFLTGRIMRFTHPSFQKHRYLVLAVSLFGIFLGALVIRKSMLSITWQKLIPYYYCAICYILIVKLLCNRLKQDNYSTKIFAYIGNNTLTILTWHFLILRLVSLLIVIIYGLPIKMVGSHPIIASYSDKGWWIVYLTAGIAIPCLIARLHKYPFFRWIHI